jgi:hypothetical protein
MHNPIDTRAWGSTFVDWRALEGAWKASAPQARWPAGLKADLGACVKSLAQCYFQTVSTDLKTLGPDHHYLGCRFAWKTPEAIEAAAEFRDVVSFTTYEHGVDARQWAFLNRLGKPAIIGEFHAGALERGNVSCRIGGRGEPTGARRHLSRVSSTRDAIRGRAHQQSPQNHRSPAPSWAQVRRDLRDEKRLGKGVRTYTS